MWARLKWENLKIAFATRNLWTFVLKLRRCSTSWKQISKTHKNYKSSSFLCSKKLFVKLVKLSNSAAWNVDWKMLVRLLLLHFESKSNVCFQWVCPLAIKPNVNKLFKLWGENFKILRPSVLNAENLNSIGTLFLPPALIMKFLFFFLLLFSKTQANNTLEYRTAS